MSNIKAKKSLGQNFLINQQVLDIIVNAADIKATDTIFEIGPGTGNLTAKLLNTQAKVIAIEKDQRLKVILNDRFKQYQNFDLIFDDIRNIYSVLIKQKYSTFKTVANIPYYLSSFLF